MTAYRLASSQEDARILPCQHLSELLTAKAPPAPTGSTPPAHWAPPQHRGSRAATAASIGTSQVTYVAETICPECSRFAAGWTLHPLPREKYGSDAFEFVFFHPRDWRDKAGVRRARKAGYHVCNRRRCFFKVRAPYWPVSDLPVRKVERASGKKKKWHWTIYES